MTKIKFLAFLLLLSSNIYGQYQFKSEKQIDRTSVKSQQRTNTCWSFATTSFLESELLRMGKGDVDLSEMFIVRNIYHDKAYNYLMRQGSARFTEGSLSHDAIRTIDEVGVMPDAACSGLLPGDVKLDHSELARGLKGYLDGVKKSKRLSTKWKAGLDGIMDAYIGEAPESFDFKGKTYTPESFRDYLGISSEDYVSFASFSHHPFYSSFILEIPDNYSNGSYYNLPIDELLDLMDYALLAGYSFVWDGDVSEETFDSRKGIAILPVDAKRDDLYTNPGKEITVTQDNRQANFESYSTTDDHLMHIVGIALDQNGTKYYLTKNSWGTERGPYDGYIYMSEAYVKMKTVGITLNKAAVPVSTKGKVGM